MTPSERALRSRIGGHTRAAKLPAARRTEIARSGADGLLERFAREIDPDNQLPEPERLRRARSALSAHMSRLALNRRKTG